MQELPTESQPNRAATRDLAGLSAWILIGCVGGIAAGVFFGEYCAPLALIGDIFVGLLRMTVLPYIIVTLIANLGRLALRDSRKLALTGGAVLILLWAVALYTVFALADTFPSWKGGTFFSTSLTEQPREFDFVDLFIPLNIFRSLSQNQVPAVVLLCVCFGLALSGIENRQQLITQLDIISKALLRIAQAVTRLTPIGVFAIAASTAGTVSMADFGKLQVYLVTYTFGTLFVGLFVLPMLVQTCTHFRYRDTIAVSKDAMLMAFATGHLIVVLPLLIENTEKLFARQPHDHLGKDINGSEDAAAVDILYPTAYAFPHVSKLLSLLFIPFAAWFLGNPMQWHEYPAFLTVGSVSYFGGPLIAIPFLLDLMQLPHDMFQLFLLTGVYGERLGDAIGAMHLTALTLITISAFRGQLRVGWLRVLMFLCVVSLAGYSTIFGIRLVFSQAESILQTDNVVFDGMQFLHDPVESIVVRDSSVNPDALQDGESLLDRIYRRGVIRVGFNEDAIPFAFFNSRGELIGHDVELSHALARDLGVTIEFVRYDRATLVEQLTQDEFDIVMSGLVGTLERSQTIRHTTPYLDVTLALVVRDHRIREFQSLDTLRESGSLRVGSVDTSRVFVDRLTRALPNIKLVELQSNQQFFDGEWKQLDALLVSAESGSAFTLSHPEFEVVVPSDLQIRLPLVYAIGNVDDSLKKFIEHWATLKRKDGTMKEVYDQWVLGQTPNSDAPRWSVIRNLLHWVD